MKENHRQKRVTVGSGEFVDLVSKAINIGADISDILTLQEMPWGERSKGRSHWSADGCIYGCDSNNSIILYITDSINNPWINHGRQYVRQIKNGRRVCCIGPLESKRIITKAYDPDDSSVTPINLSRLSDMIERDESLMSFSVDRKVLVKGEEKFRSMYGDEAFALFNRFLGKYAWGKRGVGANKSVYDYFLISFPEYFRVREILKNEKKGSMVAMLAVADLEGIHAYYADPWDSIQNPTLYFRSKG